MTTPTQPLPKRQPRPAAPELRIKAGDAGALPVIHDWAAANSWSPGAHDFRCYLDADPQSLYVGYLGDEPVSAVFVANHDAGFAHLGAYMVPPQHRGRGFGRATFDAALRHAETRVVGLHAVTDQVQNYTKSGFVADYSTWRFSGVLPTAQTPAPGDIVDTEHVDRPSLVDYDARHFRAARPAFLNSWISAPGHVARAVMDGGEIIGFGVIRPAIDHSRIGPLYARDAATAAALLRELAESAEATTIALDVPETNPAACDLAAELGLSADFEMVTMFTPGPLKPINQPTVFAVASAELG
jgi:GNAT superfamily N-acetyltransferase